jgi:hypothetical protein
MMCIVELSIVGATVNFARSYLFGLYKSVFKQVRLGRMICSVPSAECVNKKRQGVIEDRQRLRIALIPSAGRWQQKFQ